MIQLTKLKGEAVTTGIDAQEVINSLLQQIGEQATEIALLKVQLAIVQNGPKEDTPEEGGSNG